MPVFPAPFGNVKEVEVRQDCEQALELRQVWMPYNPPLVFSSVMAVFALVLLLLMGLPDSGETLAMMGGILAFIGCLAAPQCFNSTIVTVTDSELCWRHGPFPWRRGGRLAAGEVASVVYGKVRKSGISEEVECQGHRKRSFSAVGVHLRDGKGARRLFDGILMEGTAAMTAQMIARRLGSGAAARGSAIKMQRAEQEDLTEKTVLRVALVILVVVVVLVLVVVTAIVF